MIKSLRTTLNSILPEYRNDIEAMLPPKQNLPKAPGLLDSLRSELLRQLTRVKELHAKDLAEGFGTVENANRKPRRFLPKGTDFDGIPADFIEWMEDYFNNMPMKVHGFKTPNEVWNQHLEKLIGNTSPQMA